MTARLRPTQTFPFYTNQFQTAKCTDNHTENDERNSFYQKVLVCTHQTKRYYCGSREHRKNLLTSSGVSSHTYTTQKLHSISKITCALQFPSHTLSTSCYVDDWKLVRSQPMRYVDWTHPRNSDLISRHAMFSVASFTVSRSLQQCWASASGKVDQHHLLSPKRKWQHLTRWRTTSSYIKTSHWPSQADIHYLTQMSVMFNLTEYAWQTYATTL